MANMVELPYSVVIAIDGDHWTDTTHEFHNICDWCKNQGIVWNYRRISYHNIMNPATFQFNFLDQESATFFELTHGVV